MDVMPVCRVCGVELTFENWYESLRKTQNHICKSCNIKRAKERQRIQPVKRNVESRRVYMKGYMKDYRNKNRKRINEIGRLEFHRRDRELPTDTILNEPFEGAHLHHVTPSVAIYIPSELHRSVFHNLKTGRGMAEINAKVMEKYGKETKGL